MKIQVILMIMQLIAIGMQIYTNKLEYSVVVIVLMCTTLILNAIENE